MAFQDFHLSPILPNAHVGDPMQFVYKLSMAKHHGATYVVLSVSFSFRGGCRVVRLVILNHIDASGSIISILFQKTLTQAC